MRWLVSWTLYALGDAVWRVQEIAPNLDLYPAYNRLMTWSSDVQGEGDRGPWRHITPPSCERDAA